jgi:hypothetical protein
VKLSTVNARVAANKPHFAPLRGKVLATIAGGGAVGFAYAGHALAQASSPSGGIGAQLNTISGEAINSGGTAFGMACYLAAAVCFSLGVWALCGRAASRRTAKPAMSAGVSPALCCAGCLRRPGCGSTRRRSPRRAATPRSTPRRRWCNSAPAADSLRGRGGLPPGFEQQLARAAAGPVYWCMRGGGLHMLGGYGPDRHWDALAWSAKPVQCSPARDLVGIATLAAVFMRV